MQSALKFDPDKEGLSTLFRDWQITTLQILWAAPNKKYTTKDIWDKVSRKVERRVSRATVYHFLDEMAQREIIKFNTSTGRGGLRILFYSEYNENEFRKLMAEKLKRSIDENLLSLG